MTDPKKPFKTPLPPGMQQPLPPGQMIPAGHRGQELSPQQAATEARQPAAPVAIGSVRTSSRLTVEERKALEQFGWKEGDPIPTNLAQLMMQGAVNAVPGQGVELPGSTPAADRTPMSKAQRELGTQAMSEAQLALERAKTMERLALSGADASVQTAMAAAAGMGSPDVQIQDDIGASEYDDGKSKVDAGSHPPMLNCPHCSWDLRMEDPIQVDEADKQRFLQSILGQRSFQKAYRALGGAMIVTFRSLTPQELDMCFEQAYFERMSGLYQTADAYFEQLNRYRIALQLVRIESQAGINHDFPRDVDGWIARLQLNEEGRMTSRNRPIKYIYEYMFNELIVTESINRIIGGLNGDFNSLVSKLEANATNPDFWSSVKLAT